MRFASEKVLEARVALGLTQEDVAASLGVAVRTYRRYETGQVNEGGFTVRHPSRKRILARLSDELGLSVEELLLESAVPLPRPAGPHVLVPAKHFVGRTAVLDALRQAPRGVTALIGIGGAGKTSLAQQVAEGAFVWSFYQDPRVDRFLAALSDAHPRHLERLEAQLVVAPRRLVLDGLEVVQADGVGHRARGEVQDALLRRLLRSVAAGLGDTRVLLTTRFAPLDLEPWEGHGYTPIQLGPLETAESADLLERWGVKKAPALAARLGGHALSVAMIGSYVTTFLGGEASRLGELELEEARHDDRLARRLYGVLVSYLERLGRPEREVLGALSIYPHGAALEDLLRLPLDLGENDVRRAVRRLLELGLVGVAGERFSLHPFVAQLARRDVGDPIRLHETERARLTEMLVARPDDPIASPALLDRYERLLHHSVGAGRVSEAVAIYHRVLGGFAHLGLRLGNMTLGARLTRAFGEGAPLPVLYDRALYAIALGDLRGALATLSRHVVGARAADDPDALATGLRTTAFVERLLGRVDDAEGSVDASLGVATSMRAPFHRVRGLALRGALATDRGELGQAAACFEEAREHGDVPVARRGLWESERAIAAGDLDLAVRLTEANLAICEARGWGGHVAHASALLGRIAAVRGQPAHPHLERLSDWVERTGEVEMRLRHEHLAGLFGDAAASRRFDKGCTQLGYARAPLAGP